MLLDGETFDLVQHIDTVLQDDLRPRARAADQRRADAVRARDRDARLPERRRRPARAVEAARVREPGRAREGDARRLGRHASVQPLRAPADHRARPLPQPGRPAPVHRPPRADLRHARARRGRRSREGDPGRERPPPPARPAARALRLLAVLARRADGPRVEPADGLRRVPALGPAAAVPRLRRLRRGGRASSSAPAASRTTPTSGGTSGCIRGSGRSRSGSATRSRASRTRSRSPRTARRSSSSSRSNTTAASRSRRTTGS